jgi:hypothetical protein
MIRQNRKGFLSTCRSSNIHLHMKPDTDNTDIPTRRKSEHTFHIPVMGTGFTIDTALKTAQYGIASVISLVDDVLIEQMRKVHTDRVGEPYEPITGEDGDVRAHRITAYLNLVNRLVRQQVASLRAEPFEAGTGITKYFEMLPDCPTKDAYRRMLDESDPENKLRMQNELRAMAIPGSIDVNIMTKLDCPHFCNGDALPPEQNDAMAALRGFAQSDLQGSVVLSAGMHPKLYGYIARFKDFMADACGLIRKAITLKVSDYRSAIVQGKFLAKQGLWVSEYRIESGLNCGGHTFPSKGMLLGPIMEEFRQKRDELQDTILAVYNKARVMAGLPELASVPETRITVQGGIGTHEEDRLMREHFGMNGTGWGTPFLLVPEAVNLDEAHIEKLRTARGEDVYLSWSSPVGVPFWNLRNSASESARRDRIRAGRPGSSCPKGYLKMNTEFTPRPICRAARSYQTAKLKQIAAAMDIASDTAKAHCEDVLVKSCICHDLGAAATVPNGIDPEATTAVCCGPNIRHFSLVATLEEMVSHIYGRMSLITSDNRPHMFIEELRLYIDHLADEILRTSHGLADRPPQYFREFANNLIDGIDYYRNEAGTFFGDSRDRVLQELHGLEQRLKAIAIPATEPA